MAIRCRMVSRRRRAGRRAAQRRLTVNLSARQALDGSVGLNLGAGWTRVALGPQSNLGRSATLRDTAPSLDGRVLIAVSNPDGEVSRDTAPLPTYVALPMSPSGAPGCELEIREFFSSLERQSDQLRGHNWTARRRSSGRRRT
jgi:hypothetical protein